MTLLGQIVKNPSNIIRASPGPAEENAPLPSFFLVHSVGQFFLRSYSDDKQHVPLFLAVQMGSQDVVDQILPLHGVHPAEAFGGDDSNNPVVVAEVNLIWRW